MQREEIDAIFEDIVNELKREFGAEVPNNEVESYVGDAINDLRGSVSLAGMPEMVVRLARCRLGRA